MSPAFPACQRGLEPWMILAGQLEVLDLASPAEPGYLDALKALCEAGADPEAGRAVVTHPNSILRGTA